MAKFVIFLSSIASVAAFSFIGTPSSTLCRQAVHSRSRCVSEFSKCRERVICAASFRTYVLRACCTGLCGVD